MSSEAGPSRTEEPLPYTPGHLAYTYELSVGAHPIGPTATALLNHAGQLDRPPPLSNITPGSADFFTALEHAGVHITPSIRHFLEKAPPPSTDPSTAERDRFHQAKFAALSDLLLGHAVAVRTHVVALQRQNAMHSLQNMRSGLRLVELGGVPPLGDALSAASNSVAARESSSRHNGSQGPRLSPNELRTPAQNTVTTTSRDGIHPTHTKDAATGSSSDGTGQPDLRVAGSTNEPGPGAAAPPSRAASDHRRAAAAPDVTMTDATIRDDTERPGDKPTQSSTPPQRNTEKGDTPSTAPLTATSHPGMPPPPPPSTVPPLALVDKDTTMTDASGERGPVAMNRPVSFIDRPSPWVSTPPRSFTPPGSPPPSVNVKPKDKDVEAAELDK